MGDHDRRGQLGLGGHRHRGRLGPVRRHVRRRNGWPGRLPRCGRLRRSGVGNRSSGRRCGCADGVDGRRVVRDGGGEEGERVDVPVVVRSDANAQMHMRLGAALLDRQPDDTEVSTLRNGLAT